MNDVEHGFRIATSEIVNKIFNVRTLVTRLQ